MIKLSIWYLCIVGIGLLLSSSNEIRAGISDWGTEPLDDGARCDVNAVRRANREQLHLLLEELTNTTFFRLFRVGLDGECPMNANSSLKDDPHKNVVEDTSATKEEEEEEHSCAVDTDTGDAQCSLNFGGPAGGGGGGEKDLPPWVFHKQPVDRTISVKEQKSVESDLSCETPDFWFDMCHGLVTEDESRGWINLQLNPERHTGYNGSKVWKVIYEQACFADRAMSNNDTTIVCGHEERVLQRLISGLHASINTHISLSFHPPAVSGGGEWRPDPARFMETVGSHPDRIKNLNFAFVVLLRALRKAAPVLSSFSYAVSGDTNEDLRTGALVRRLLESHLMSSCSQVFDSFDESLMFQNRTSDLKVAFKKAFLSISRTLDCIRCQKCRLHGKMQLTGIGLALKILLLSDEVLAKTPVNRLARREEIVALFNTLHKFSHAIASMDYLTELHLALKDKPASNFDAGSVPPSLQQPSSIVPSVASSSSSTSVPLPKDKMEEEKDVFVAVEAIAKAFYDHHVNDLEEKTLLNLLLHSPSDGTSTVSTQSEQQQKTALIALARGYGKVDSARFASHVRRLVLDINNNPSTTTMSGSSSPTTGSTSRDKQGLTIVVVGSGLAGSSAVLSLLDNTNAEQVRKVILVEKQTFLGGNSVYASSGMNAVDEEARALGDSVEAFAQDVAKSSGKGVDYARSPIVRALTEDSESALTWIRQRLGQKFEKLGRLGGHSFARTHRPEQGQAGAELVYGMHRAMRQFQEDGRLQILRGERLDEIIPDSQPGTTGRYSVRMASGLKLDHISAVILASGGYAANKHLLPANVRRFGTTNGPFSTGDAVSILSRLGAEFKDMDQVQLHPTAFSSPNKDEQQPLCAEILRGVGGILLNANCERFSDELGTRAYVSQKMIDSKEEDFVLLLTEEQARSAEHFRSVYTKRGLLAEIDANSIESYLKCPTNKLKRALEAYVASSQNGRDEFNKTNFPMADTFLSTKKFYIGRVQPAVHYCMGGVATDEWGRVQVKENETLLKGVYAAGEVSGGLHGKNRLGGNGMTEGLVFGRRVARAVLKDFGLSLLNGDDKVEDHHQIGASINSNNNNGDVNKLRIISKEELAKHRFKNDCWVQVRDKVYDFTNFLSEHPGGMKAILVVAGKDGTELYEEMHTMAFLDDFVPIGEISSPSSAT